MGVTYCVRVASAHRTPQKVLSLAHDAEENGAAVFIAIAGKAAALPGLIAASTKLPVIGIPVASPELGGLDALVSMTQTPKGIPVATMGLGKAGAQNGALLAARIVALSQSAVGKRLTELVRDMAEEVNTGEAKIVQELT